MRVRLYGRDFRFMSMLLNLAVDLLFHVSINDMQLGCGDQSISQAGRQAVDLHFHVPTNHMQLVSGDQSVVQSVRQRGRHAAGSEVKFSARQSSKQSTGQPVVQYFTHAGMFELNGQTVNVLAIHSVSQSISFSVNQPEWQAPSKQISKSVNHPATCSARDG